MKSTVDTLAKGIWSPDGLAGDAEFVAGRHHLFDGTFTWPVLVARRRALDTNIATMAAYCARHGVSFAPHGKTTMSPGLFAAQLAAGAWGITVATPYQALAARAMGVPRVLLANEVLEPAVLRWAAGQVAAGWEFMSYVDSLAGVEVLRQARPGATGGLLRVLVEVGVHGGRTGCRDVATAALVAQAAADVPGVVVAGVSAFEGLLPDPDQAAGLLTLMLAAADAVEPYTAQPLLLTAGGSRWFDRVVAVLVPAATDRGWRVMLRGGAYVSHDHGLYASTSPFVRDPVEGEVIGALEVWAQVLSTPEPGLALVGAGKRDVPQDAGMPVVLAVRDTTGRLRAVDPVPVRRLDDQHAYVDALDAAPGDLVRLGISHPCTAFDRWRVIPVLDDDDRVVDLLRTYF